MVNHMKVRLSLMQERLLKDASYTMHIKHLMREMYYISQHGVLCGLCGQEERSKLLGELEGAREERAILEKQLAYPVADWPGCQLAR
jgi:hypothetical protein